MGIDDAIGIPRGFRASAVRAGIKPSGGLDLAVLIADDLCSAAGTFTTNRVCAAPVKWDRSILPSDQIRGVVINAGNANAATGTTGDENVLRTATIAAEHLGCEPSNILVASTGVIGRQLPMDRLETGLLAALGSLSEEVAAFHHASRAIMTTDTRAKLVSLRRTIRGEPVTLLGIAKGAAMIGPNMATMLAFLLTDAPVGPGVMQGILTGAVEDSFNCISVEGHQSTNDTVLLLGGGPNRLPLMGADLAEFAGMIREACVGLARMIPEDGEGATHFITIDVEGCADRSQARKIAEAVANSALVKTAIHGADPNWGRIVSAAGYSGVMFDESQLSLWLNGVALYRDGMPVEFDDAAVAQSLRSQRDVQIRLALTLGSASIRFWTSDLTAEYIRLNADYTT
jgi:glutamate N-acetyltransferase/amino-acid N-acetyltransferase